MVKCYEKKATNKRVYKFEEFDTLHELISTNTKRQVKNEWAFESMEKKNRYGLNESWYGVPTVQKAYSIMESGWNEGTEEFWTIFKKIQKEQERVKTKFYNDIVGFMPNVPLFLIGVPTSMINMKRVNVPSKVIDIIYNNTATGGTEAEDLIRAGNNILTVIATLEAKGYRVNLKVSRCLYNKNLHDCECLLVKLKDAKEPLNIKKIAYPMAHPSWLRVMTFEWQDKSPITPYVDGRGIPYHTAVSLGKVSKGEIESVLDNKTFFIDFSEALKGCENVVQKIIKK